MRVIFSHGHLSSPSSEKIRRLTPLALDEGWKVEAPDYRPWQDDPHGRVAHLESRLSANAKPSVLVGSSLGGLVSLAAAEKMPVAGLFLMAPALFMEDRVPGGVIREAYQPLTGQLCVVHGWQDDIVPPEGSVKFARALGASLHLLPDDHSLHASIPTIAGLLQTFLRAVRQAL